MPPSTAPIEGKKALIVLNMQKAYVGKEHEEEFKFDEDILIKVNDAIAENNSVIYVRSLMKYNIITMFAKLQMFDGTKAAQLTEGLFMKGDIVFDKYKPGAFTNKKLIRYLIANNIDAIEVCGVDVNNCVYQTVLGAIENQVSAVVNTKAITTMNEKRLKHQYNMLKAKGVQFLE